MFGLVGTDVNSGAMRFTLGLEHLSDGIALVALAMGLFGIADVLRGVNRIGTGEAVGGKMSMRLSGAEVKQAALPVVRGAGIGSFFGTLPGTGSAVASFISYAVEKKLARDPSRFGKGAIEGVAGPESCNNAAAQTAFIPTMTLGIPGDATMALMLGALMIHNIQPGPQLISEHPDVFWGLIASFWVGNLLLLVLNIPLVGIWTRLLSVPYRIVFPCVLFFISIGVYSTHNSLFDVGVVLAIGFYAAYAPPPLALYGTLWILLIAFVTIELPAEAAAGIALAGFEGEDLRVLIVNTPFRVLNDARASCQGGWCAHGDGSDQAKPARRDRATLNHRIISA